MTLVEEESNKLLALAKSASRMLAALEPYLENKNIPLGRKDYESISVSKQFLDYAVQGCDAAENPKLLFQCDYDFFATPASALKLAIEILHNRLPKNKIPETLKGIKSRWLDYKIILEKFEKGESFEGKYVGIAKEVISFFDGIQKKCDETMFNLHGPIF